MGGLISHREPGSRVLQSAGQRPHVADRHLDGHNDTVPHAAVALMGLHPQHSRARQVILRLIEQK